MIFIRFVHHHLSHNFKLQSNRFHIVPFSKRQEVREQKN